MLTLANSGCGRCPVDGAVGARVGAGGAAGPTPQGRHLPPQEPRRHDVEGHGARRPSRVADLVVGTVEQRQINLGRPVYAVVALNRSLDVVRSYTLAAVIVGADGATKAVQRLATVKNLKAGQERKQNTEIRAAIPSISDRIIFLVADVEASEGERWALDDAAMREMVKAAITGQ